MSFRESIIIPLETYKRCQLSPNDTTRNILVDKSLPSDEKLKLIAHEQRLTKLKKTKTSSHHPNSAPISDNRPVQVTRKLILPIQPFPLEDRPIIQAILDVLNEHSQEISWEPNSYTVIIDGTPITNSNVLRVFQYFFKLFPVTSVNDIPAGTREVFDKLLKFKVPTSWIKRRPPPLRTPRKRRKPKRFRQDIAIEDPAIVAHSPLFRTPVASLQWDSFDTPNKNG